MKRHLPWPCRNHVSAPVIEYGLIAAGITVAIIVVALELAA